MPVAIDEIDRLLAADKLPDAIGGEDEAGVTLAQLVRRHIRLGRDADAVEVVVADRARHGERAVRMDHTRNAELLIDVELAAEGFYPLALLWCVRLVISRQIERAPAAETGTRLDAPRVSYVCDDDARRGEHGDDGGGAVVEGEVGVLERETLVHLEEAVLQSSRRREREGRRVRLELLDHRIRRKLGDEFSLAAVAVVHAEEHEAAAGSRHTHIHTHTHQGGSRLVGERDV